MTSRVSFPKLLFETLRRHLAAVLIVILVFLVHIISFFLNVQNIFNSAYVADYNTMESYSSSIYAGNIPTDNLEYMIEALVELCSPNLWNAILAMLIGVYLAFDFLRYMHSKKETDFYASLPIARQTWFKVLFLDSFGLFFVLSAITTGIELAIAFGTGYGSLLILQNMLWNLLCMLGVFLATWATTALAMIMTGHSIIAFLGLGVLSCYVPLILNYLIPSYSSSFFDTYVSANSGTFSESAYYFSPITLGYQLMYSWKEWLIKEHWTYFVGVWIFSIIVSIIAYLLFLRRPSETAGRAMAFEKANSPIRFLLVIPLSLYAGLFLREIASYGSSAWLIFGILFAAVLIHGIMEAIFQFDVRAAFAKKKQLLLSILLSFAFVAVFLFDLFGYDSYIPKAESIKNVQLSSYMTYHDKGDWGFEKDGLHGDDIEVALAVVKDVMATETPEHYGKDSDYYAESLQVTYTLKSGVIVTRHYNYNAYQVPESLNQLYTKESFKDDYCILYKLDTDRLLSYRINNGLQTLNLKLSDEEMLEFKKIFLEEHTKMSLKDMLYTSAVFELVVDYVRTDSDYKGSESYYIYPNFTNTLAFLEEKEIRTFGETEDVSLENLHLYGGKFENTEEKFVSDAQQLKALQKYMVSSQFLSDFTSDEYIYGELRYQLDGEAHYMSVCVKNSDLEAILDE